MESIEPEGLVDATRIGYSHATVADGTLYVSGQVGWDAEFVVVEGVEAQTRQAFENVEAVLAAVDRSLADVTKVTAHVVGLPAERDAFFAAWRETFTEEPYPALTLLGAAALARDDLLVEVEVAVPDVG